MRRGVFLWMVGEKLTLGFLKNGLVLFEGKVPLGFAPGKGGRKGARLVKTICFHGDTHRVPRVWARRPSAGRGEGRRVQRGGDGGTGAGSPHAPSLALAERAATAIPRKGSRQQTRVVSAHGDCMVRSYPTIRASCARLPLTRFAGAPLCGGEQRRTRSRRTAPCIKKPGVGAWRSSSLQRWSQSARAADTLPLA